MQIIDATAAVLMALAVFIGAMAWQIRESLEKLIQTQNEILAELVYARYRPGDSGGSKQDDSEPQPGQSLKVGIETPDRLSVRSAKA